MRIIVDAMGGDNAPHEIVKGAVLAQREFGVDITLVGREADIERCLQAEGAQADGEKIVIRNATEVVEMEDDPAMAVRRKKDSSMAVALHMLRDGEGDAVVSAGSTGALLTGATLVVKRIRGIRRAAMAPVIPSAGKGTLLIDCGANAECTPEYLVQFAHMGSLYAKLIQGCENPRVGLLNIGTEETKGTETIKETYKLLTAARDAGELNFVGNIESRDVFADKVDVVVTDGFTGNILIKTIEGTAMYLMKMLKNTMTKSTKNKLAALVLKKDIGELKALLDSDEVGGIPMIGITKPVIKAHGSSNATAIRSAIRQAAAFADSGVIEGIEKSLARTAQAE